MRTFITSIIGETENDDQRNKTKFIDLNVDCLLHIFKYLDFNSLLNTAEVSEELSFFAAEVFKRKTSKIEVLLLSNDYFAEDSNDESFHEDILSKALGVFGFRQKRPKTEIAFNDSIKIFDFEMSLNTLKHFGRVIEKLSVQFNYLKSTDTIMISEFINKYCSESLVHLHFEDCTCNCLQSMKEPFENVENLAFTLRLENLGNTTLSMNELFPKVRRLSFNSIMVISGTYIDCHLPYLERLDIHTVGASIGDVAVIQKKFGKLLQKNPQIRHIELFNVVPYFLKLSSEVLPNLENITLRSYRFTNDIIQFEKVRKLTVKSGYATPRNATFPNLQELWIQCYSVHCKGWIQFLEQHNNISQLHIEQSQINDEIFIKFIKNLKNIVQMSISLLKGTFISAQNIIKFIQEHEYLMEFSITFCKLGDQNILRHELQDDWIIRKFFRGLYFQRKTEFVCDTIIDRSE